MLLYKQELMIAFARVDIVVFTDSIKLRECLRSKSWGNKNLLIISSGNFDGVDYMELAGNLLG